MNDNTKNDLLFPIISGLVIFVFGFFFKDIYNSVKEKRKQKTNYPLIHKYPMDNNKTRNMWLEDIKECKYIYYMNKKTYGKVVGDDSPIIKGKTEELHFDFAEINIDRCKTYIKTKEIFAIIFDNNSNDTALLITEITSQDSLIQNIANKSRLSRLNASEKVCIICNIKDVPFEFGGTFKSDPVLYRIKDTSMDDIYPTSYSKKVIKKTRDKWIKKKLFKSRK